MTVAHPQVTASSVVPSGAELIHIVRTVPKTIQQRQQQLLQIDQLLSHGVDINTIDENNISVIHWIIWGRRHDILYIVIQHSQYRHVNINYHAGRSVDADDACADDDGANESIQSDILHDSSMTNNNVKIQ